MQPDLRQFVDRIESDWFAYTNQARRIISLRNSSLPPLTPLEVLSVALATGLDRIESDLTPQSIPAEPSPAEIVRRRSRSATRPPRYTPSSSQSAQPDCKGTDLLDASRSVRNDRIEVDEDKNHKEISHGNRTAHNRIPDIPSPLGP
jgi:hypothetical protein